MQLRPPQIELEDKIVNSWDHGHRNVLAVFPTGGGKTVLFSDLLSKHTGFKCAIAHRQELVSQISLSLARYGVYHRIVAPKKIRNFIRNQHIQELGQHFYDPSADCAVIGVDTLLRRYEELKPWLNQVTFWVIDEAHHVIRANKWGKAVELFPNAKGLGVTATACRADGKGLGAHADGVFHSLVEGETMRGLINTGYLCDYRIFAPPSDIDLSTVGIGSNGDFNSKQLKQAAQKSHIVGDVVAHYLRLAPGKQGITFATDVETASEIAAKFRAAGVKAEVLHAKVKDDLRIDIIRRFRNCEIQQIVNVDILGEGFDVPGIEVVSMARPTESYGLYCQQFGRALRLLEGKLFAMIIDHVNNVVRHNGPPDVPRKWTLDRRDSKKKERDPDIIPVRVCQVCTAPYEMIYKACPFCGHVHLPPERTQIEYIDGDLTEMDPKMLADMRGEIARIDVSPEQIKSNMLYAGAQPIVAASAAKNQRLRSESQQMLRDSISWYRAHQAADCSDSEAYRRFFFRFGIDVMKAQTLGRKDAEALAIQINKYIDALVNKR